MREIMLLADRANQYVDQQKPWVLAKDPARVDEARAVATQAINLFRVLMTYLAPVLPGIAAQAGEWLGADAFARWDGVRHAAARSRRSASIRSWPRASIRPWCKQLVATPASRACRSQPHQTTGKPVISIDDFTKLDLRAAQGARSLARRRLRQAAAAQARPRQRAAQCVLRHQRQLHARRPGRPLRGDDRQPRAAQDALWRVRRHGAVRQRRRTAGVFLLSADAGVTPGMKIS